MFARMKSIGRGVLIAGATLAPAALTLTVGGRTLLRGFARAAKRPGVHPLRIFRAAERLYPELKGTLRVVRRGIPEGNAAAFTRKLYGYGFHHRFAARALGIPTELGRRANVMIASPRYSEVPVGWLRRGQVTRALRAMGHVAKFTAQPSGVIGPALAHEMGHLASKGRIGVGLNPGGLRRLYEEARASVHGAAIYRGAGGRLVDYAKAIVPAYGTYVGISPYTAAASGYAAARATRRKGRR